MTGRSGWIVVAAVAIGAVTIGLIAAALVLPADSPRAASTPPVATIRIAPTPTPAPDATAPPVPEPRVMPRPASVRRVTPHAAPSRAEARDDTDAGTVTTINSW